MKSHLKVEGRDDGWWITGWPEGFEDCGPYPTKAEAAEAKTGLECSLTHWDEPSFWSSCCRPG